MTTAEFDWFLGFLQTDGSIVRPSYRGKGDESHISFCIHHNDNECLHKIKRILNTSGKVRLYPNYKSPQSQLNIYDRRDIIMNYSYIKQRIPDTKSRHFVRGMVDGDGCINYRENRKTLRINVVGEYDNILQSTSDIITSQLKLPSKSPRKGPKIYIIEWEGKIARLIAWWIYHGNVESCCLARKRKYYIEKLKIDNSSPINEFISAVGLSVHTKNNGIVLDMNVNYSKSLEWCHIVQNILGGTPVPLNKGKSKYYGLYFPVTDTQDISIKEWE